MTAIYQLYTDEQREFLREYVRVVVKQDVSTTGLISVDDVRVLIDPNANFESNDIDTGDTVEILLSSPIATTPSVGFYTVLDVVDNNTVEIDGAVIPLGTGVSYRVTSTGPLQEKINSLSRSISVLMNVDITEALFLENINTPWYNTVTSIALNYFNERNGLDGLRFLYPVYQSDLDNVTINPPPLILAPGPLLFPYGYGSILPDRRNPGLGSALAGTGTPSLVGQPDTSQIAIPAYSYGTGGSGGGVGGPLNILTGESPSIVEEEAFYVGTASQFPSPPNPGYQDDDSARISSIKDAISSALNREMAAHVALAAELDLQLADLQVRGHTGTDFYASVSVARKQIDIAYARALFHLTNATSGVPAIGLTAPASAARRTFITSTRPPQISSRVAQLLVDQAHWIQSRYSFLNRRVNRSDGSLTLLRRATTRLVNITDEMNELLTQRVVVNNIVGEGT